MNTDEDNQETIEVVSPTAETEAKLEAELEASLNDIGVESDEVIEEQEEEEAEEQEEVEIAAEEEDEVNLELEEEGEEEEEAEEEEEQEAEEVDPTEDPEGWIKQKFGNSKSGKVRKWAVAQEAANQSLKVQLEEAKQSLVAKDNEIEQVRENAELSTSKLPEVDPQQYAPIKDIEGKYSDELNKVSRRLDAGNKKYLQENHVSLRNKLRSIKEAEGDESKEAMTEFEDSLRDKFTDRHVDRVVDFLEEAVALDYEYQDKKQEFDKNQDQVTSEHWSKRWEDADKSIVQSIPKLYEVDEEFTEKNPYDFRTMLSRYSNKEPEGFQKFVSKDSKIISRIINGDKPFNYEDTEWRTMDKDEARKQYHRQVQETKKMQAQLAPDLLALGLMAQRFVPALQKKVGTLNAKKTNSPKPRKNAGTPKKAKSTARSSQVDPSSFMGDLEAELAESSANVQATLNE